jgi:hypothetical protein
MNERIHAYLDGEFPRSVLSPAEAAELAELEEAVHLTAGYVRGAAKPDFASRVMLALSEPQREPARSGPGEALRGALRWLWTPRPVALRPAYAFALALVGVALGGALFARGSVSPGAELAASAPAAVFVQFRLDAPGASHVSLAGSFTRWQPEYELREVAPGVWTALVPLHPGIHDYLFVVDGDEWIPDPAARPVEDGFGGTNSRLFLASPAAHT